MAETVTQDVLDNMGDLGSYIEGRGYTNAIVAMNGETIVSNPYGPERDPASPQAPYATYGVAPQPGGGVVPQTPVPDQPARPQVSNEQYQAAMAYAQRMEQAALAAARDRRETEDQAFLNSISHLPRVEQDREVLIRYNQQLEQAYRGMHETMTERQQREEAEDQASAKAFIGMRMALQSGLAWGNPDVQRMILKADDMPEMERIVSFLSGGGQPQQTAGQVAGRVMAAPASGARAPRQSGPRQGSGDIAGLISSRPYQYADH